MNYQAIYDRIIERNRNTPKIKKQTEDHHIIPRSFAKPDGIEDIDGSWNRVNLPLREHFICHLLLARIWRVDKFRGPKTAKALRMMSKFGKYNSRNYSWLKLSYDVSIETREKLRQLNKGRTFSEETIQKMIDSCVKRNTPEYRKRMSEVKKGHKRSTESIEKQKKTITGRKFSEEHKAAIQEAALKRNKRSKVCCEHCGKYIDIGMYVRWHGSKCNQLK